MTCSPHTGRSRGVLSAFRHRNFALFWLGALLSNAGSWMQNLAVPFVVYQLTASAAWVLFAGFLQFLPVVFVGPLGGSIADRHPRRTVLLVTQLAQALVAATLAIVWASGRGSLPVVIGLVMMGGVIGGLNIPSWQAFVSELVPRDDLLNAVTLNSMQFNAARFLGPLAGGLVLGTIGVTAAFALNAVSFLAVISALLLIRANPAPRVQPAGRSLWADFVTAIRATRRYPGILACFVAVVALGGLGGPVSQQLVVFAREVFGVGDFAYGLLGAALGFGSILGAPIIGRAGGRIARSRLLFVAMVAYGGALVTFGAAPVYAVAFGALLVGGAGYLAIASTLNTTIQLQVEEAIRGRVLAIYIMFLTAALPLGLLLQGLAVSVIGPRATVVGAGLVFFAVTGWLKTGSGLMSHLDDDGPAEPATADP
ncbi:MAG: MFS transporter [Acidimicrobiales bacterium]|nr:MFS transporter [Acidimicrobiales bacterium]